MPTHYSVQSDPATVKMDELLAPTSCPPSAPPACRPRALCWMRRAPNTPGPLALVELENGGDAPTLRGGHRKLLRHHALQLVQLLRHGGD